MASAALINGRSPAGAMTSQEDELRRVLHVIEATGLAKGVQGHLAVDEGRMLVRQTLEGVRQIAGDATRGGLMEGQVVLAAGQHVHLHHAKDADDEDQHGGHGFDDRGAARGRAEGAHGGGSHGEKTRVTPAGVEMTSIL
ncbi:hypothetical protein [Stigmatella aurantiaca]|uniref:hypothetical protein n=1 Tax=Stigmatella aurantiaca TaxID=41 RepID=UPI0012F9990E|nr:hypothetical protein [Stigmatella aurantiaca]